MNLLSDDELNILYDEFDKSDEDNWERFLNKAIIKGFIKWGEDCCSHDTGIAGGSCKKWACPICRIELKELLSS